MLTRQFSVIIVIASLLFTACSFGNPSTPTPKPTSTPEPVTPTLGPTSTPEPVTPTLGPTSTPEPVTPTLGPTSTPEPTIIPTSLPTVAPTFSPTAEPTYSPTAKAGHSTIIVGSLDFTEQKLLGQLAILVLEEAGYDVVDKTGFGDTDTGRNALNKGEWDMMWEYTGSALSLFHEFSTDGLPSDVKVAWETVSRLDALEYELIWQTSANFNDPYILMVKPGMIAEELVTIEDLAAFMNNNDSPLKLCVEDDFYARPDGLLPMQEYYGFAFKEENISIIPYDQLYEGVRDGTCDVAEGFSTDGRITAWGFQNLIDSKGFFPAYNPAPVILKATLDQYPELAQLLGQIGPLLDHDTMSQLNARVDIGADREPDSGDEESVENVASNFLQKVGLIGQRPKIVVGSLDFTEQKLLGQLAILVLEEARYDVVDKTGFGDTDTGRNALNKGEWDMMWEYTGSALSLFHEFSTDGLPSDVKVAWETVSRLDALEYELIWQTSANFNDSYTLMVKPGMIAEELVTIEDLAAFMNNNDSPLKLCVEDDFYGRRDGLLPMQEYYGFAFKEENISIIPYDQLYEGLRDGTCDVAEGFSTDGRISAWGFQNLIDSKGFFPAYNPAPVILKATLDQYPELAQLLGQIGPRLDHDTMSQLNARVDIGADGEPDSGDEESVETVARLFLCEVGLFNDCPAPTTTEMGDNGIGDEVTNEEPSSQIVCQDVVANGSFENDGDWELPPTDWSAEYSTDRFHSGERALRLGLTEGDDRLSQSVARQRVVIPQDAVTATLSYWYYPISSDLDDGSDVQGGQIYNSELNEIQRKFLGVRSNEQAWVLGDHDLSGFIGEEVILYFYVQNDGDGQPSAMYLDDVSVQVCYPAEASSQ